MDWIIGILKQFDLVEGSFSSFGLFAVFFVAMHIVMYVSHKRTVRILIMENDRLSAENRRLLERDDRNMVRFDELYDKMGMMEEKRND